ncbi:hypothetical protein BJ165DRAFT_1526387 [Panaeolus papilionaceus]|nr:hypothetical protein BJ165DRAFT_1526387 [Panaeolus papilionaceus]
MPLSALYPPCGRWRSLRCRLLFFVFLLLSVGSEVVVLNKYGEIADILGRYYAMDCDERWERIKIAVDGLVNGVGEKVDAEKGVVDDEKDTTDEFLKLIIVDSEEGRIKDDDTPFFFNYRSDRMCEIVSILGDVEHPSEFEGFKLPQHLAGHAGNYNAALHPRGGGEEEEGVLWDVAPTVLDVMGLEKPKETTGRSWHRGYLKATFHGGRRESHPGTYRRTLLHKNHKLNKNSRVVSHNYLNALKGWNGDSVRVADPSFNLCDLVQKVATYQQIEDPADDLLMSLILSSSPLTSLELSACSTPVLLDDETPQLQHRATIEGTIEALKKVGPSAEPDLHRGNSTASATQMGKRKRARSRKDDLAALKCKNERNKQQSKANRKKKRQREVELQISMPPVASKVHQRYTQQMQPLQSAIDTKENSNCTQNAYVGKKSAYDCDMAYTLDDLVGESSRFNFQLIKWNGITPKPIDVSVAADLLEKAREECQFSNDDHHQRPRGPFSILRCSVSHGGGQVRPCNVAHRDTKKNRHVIQRLNRAPAFRRISNYTSSVFASWAPQMHKYYEDTLAAIHGKYPDLERPFLRSAFSATTYNMGPQTVCFPHTDLANLAYGWCAIVALGDYNPTLGGHLVLWECKLVVEFPPGSLVFIPSAIIAHSNTPIQPHEHRYSFTQYTAGGLFRWVDQEFKSQKDYQASKTKEELEKIDANLKNRWEEGMARLPCLSPQI